MSKLTYKILISCAFFSASISSFACDWNDLPPGLRGVVEHNKQAFEKREDPKKACVLQTKGKNSFFRFFSKEVDPLSTKEPHLFQYQKCGDGEWQHVATYDCRDKYHKK